MSLLSILKSVGKDFSHVETWINDGLKIAEPIIGVFDPPIGAIITAIETSLGAIPSTAPPLTAQTVQNLITAAATTHAVASCCCPPMTGCPCSQPSPATPTS